MGSVAHLRANDSLRNLAAGMGDPLRDKAAGSSYGFQYLDDVELSNIYRSNWLGRKIVDVPAMDAVRKGRDWQADQDQIEAIEAEENRLGFWPKLLEVKTKARLWGGAAIYIGTGDNDLTEPLLPERIGKGGVKYLTVLTRRDMSAGEIDQNVLSEFFGRPSYYEVTGSSEMVRIHPSRFAVFIGALHGDSVFSLGINQGWGDSILQAAYNAVRNADSTAANIASLVFEANVDVFRIPDFMLSLEDPDYSKKIIDRFMLAATVKGVNRALILDKDEEYDRKAINFATLPDVTQSFLQIAAGAADIPVTRLIGQSPAGMSATGESDMLNYYDRVSSIQNLEMTPALNRLDECLIRSALGSRPPEVFYMWSPLKQMTEKELADIGTLNATTAKTLVDAGIFTSEEIRKAVTNQMVESGFYPGLDQIVEETGQNWQEELTPKPIAADPNVDNVLRAQDAAPRTLYVSRKVLNGADIIAWAKGQGFTSTLPASDLHVTIVFSRTPVDWMKMGNSWDGKLTIDPGGPRLMDQFGDATVLLFANRMLEYRHQEMEDLGATWDHQEYQPHITISYGGAPADLSRVAPYQGEIVLGPEIFAEVKEDWKTGLTEQ